MCLEAENLSNISSCLYNDRNTELVEQVVVYNQVSQDPKDALIMSTIIITHAKKKMFGLPTPNKVHTRCVL